MRTKILFWAVLACVSASGASGCTFHSYAGSTMPQKDEGYRYGSGTQAQPRLVTETQFASAARRPTTVESQGDEIAATTPAKTAPSATTPAETKPAAKPVETSKPTKATNAAIARTTKTKPKKPAAWHWRQAMSDSDALGLPRPERDDAPSAAPKSGAAGALRRASASKDRTETLAPRAAKPAAAPAASTDATATMQLASSQRGSRPSSEQTMSLSR